MDSPTAAKSAKTDKKSASPAAAAAAAAASPAAPTKSPASPAGANAGPEIETLQDATNEAYTPPPKPVEKKLKRRRSRSKKSLKLKAERRRVKDLENRRRQKIVNRESDIVAESAPAGTVPAENNDKASPASEGSEDFLNSLLNAQSVPDSPLLDEEGNPMEEDLSEAQPLFRLIKAVSNLVAYLMDHPLVPVAIGVALIIILTGKL